MHQPVQLIELRAQLSHPPNNKLNKEKVYITPEFWRGVYLTSQSIKPGIETH
jgi:hypothetical protein